MVQSDPTTPIKFNDAWNHENEEQRKLWRDAIRKELNLHEQKERMENSSNNGNTQW